MTAKQLIDFLSKLEPDTRIFTRGYEGRFEDIKPFKVEKFVLDVNSEWYYGSHARLSSFDEKPKDKIIVKGVCL